MTPACWRSKASVGDLEYFWIMRLECSVGSQALPVCMHAACPAYTQAGYIVTSTCVGTAAGTSCTPAASCDSGAGYLGIVVPSAATCSSTGAWSTNTALSGCSAAGKRYSHSLPTHLPTHYPPTSHGYSHSLPTHLPWLQPLNGHQPWLLIYCMQY